MFLHLGAIGAVAADVAGELQRDIADPAMGWFGTIGLLLYAYSLGAGTYTGIEAVSNSMPVMREPRVATAQRTMTYMAASLALTAGGLMLAYLLLKLTLPPGGTPSIMNLHLTQEFVSDPRLGLPPWLGVAFLLVTIISEGASSSSLRSRLYRRPTGPGRADLVQHILGDLRRFAEPDPDPVPDENAGEADQQRGDTDHGDGGHDRHVREECEGDADGQGVDAGRDRPAPAVPGS